jgi:uncharacterized membrane protein YbaN (DUF454 family)
VWQTIRVTLGIALMGLGLIGVLVPVIPGLPLLLAGVATVGTGHPLVRPLIRWAKAWRRRSERKPGASAHDAQPPSPLGTRSLHP